MSKRGYTASKNKETEPTPVKNSKDKGQDEPAFRPSSILTLAKVAVRIFKDNFVTLGFILIIPSLLYSFGQALVEPFISGYASDPEMTNLILFGGILMILASIWLFFTMPTAYYVLAQAVHGRRPTIIDSYRHGSRFLLRLLGLYALLTSIIIATALLIFPVFIFLRRYILAPFFLIDGDTAIRTAMQRSADATKPYRWYIWQTLAFAVLVFGVSYWIQTHLKVVGLLVTVPLSCLLFIMFALRYKEVTTLRSASTIEK